MVSVVVVKMSELGDRWDAQFHIARVELQGRVSELRSSISEEEAIRRVGEVPFSVRRHLAVLVRGNATDRKAIARATREYPHLALALVERDLSPAVQALREEIAKNERALANLLCLTAPEIPQSEKNESVDDVPSDGAMHPGVVYPLLDPTKYDDDHGSGYAFVTLPDSEEDAVRYSICDMWVVDEEGNVHPGYAECPVPILLSDVDLGSGFRKDLDLPEPRSSLARF